MALAERIILTPKFPGRIIKISNQNRELKAALDETKLLLKDHRQQCLKIMDLSTSPAFQPVFIKFWQLFLQLRQQEEFTSGESGRCTLPASTYLSAMELVKKALGSAMATDDHLLQLQNQDTEVSYKRFCYDFVCCLGDEVLEISPAEYRLDSFEATLRTVFKACTRVRDLKVELREVEDVQRQWDEKDAKEVNAPALKLPSLIETITRMAGTTEDRLVGRRPRTTVKLRQSSMTHSVPKSQPQAPTAREIQIRKLNNLRRQLSSTAQELSSLTALSVASPGLAPKYTPRTEFSAPPSSGVMFTSLRNETASRKVMSKRMIRFAFPKSPKQPGNQNLKLKGRKVRGSSVPQHSRDSMSRGQQVTLDSHPDVNYQSFDGQKINRSSNSRMKLKNDEQKKVRTPLNVVIM